MGTGAVVKNILVRWLRKEELISNIADLRPKQVEECWRNLEMDGVTNKQKEIIWMSFHEWLLTMDFLKIRDLVRNERCVREGCGGIEKVRRVSGMFFC